MSEILELVDRLIATSNRMAVAEHDLEELTEQFHQLEDALSVAKERIAALELELKNRDSTVSYWYQKSTQFEKELEELKAKLEEPKDDTVGT